MLNDSLNPYEPSTSADAQRYGQQSAQANEQGIGYTNPKLAQASACARVAKSA